MLHVEVLGNLDRCDAGLLVCGLLREDLGEGVCDQGDDKLVFLSDLALTVLVLPAQQPAIDPLDDRHVHLPVEPEHGLDQHPPVVVVEYYRFKPKMRVHEV